ncbi:Gfo/Idh/MocA family oxidoreductase [Anaerolentibacter hominis]|uniref:Gfo/Idh/MocA family protein n=1 Tax=Anaerolentibacter hominis TaxID=3079009 RepID=UPI0031B80824
MRQINWGILGLGWIGGDFSQALCDQGTGVYAVASEKPGKAEAWKEKYHAKKAYTTYEAMMDDPDIDVIYIATPHSNHYEYAMECLKRGKNIFVEKAITVCSEQLEDMKKLAAEKNLFVAEAQTIYHMPIYDKIQEVMQTGKLGPVKMVQVNFGSCKEYDVTNRFFNQDLAGGALLDIGVYALSFVRPFLKSQPDEVLTTVKRFETGVDECSGIILKNPDEEMAVVSLTMRAKQPKQGVIACENGFITVGNYPRADKATITWTEDGRVETLTAGETEKALQYEVEYVNQVIAGERKESTLTFTTDVMDLMTNVRHQWGITFPFENK